AAREAFLQVVDFLTTQPKETVNLNFAGGVPYLMLTGTMVAGWQMAKSLLVAHKQLQNGHDDSFMSAKISTARFYAEHILNHVPSMGESIIHGGSFVTAMPVESF